MASNNYSAFPYGSAQYNAAGGPSSGYNAPGQVAYPAVTNATFANAAAYQTAAVAAGQPGYASAGAGNAPGYAGYGDYGRALQSYDATKTFYQQASTGYNATQNAGKTHYSAPPVKNPTVNKTLVVAKDKPANAIKATVAGATGNVAVTATTTAAAAAAGAPGYSNYDAALYTASMYMAQQQQGGTVTTVGGKPNGNSATTWTAHYHGGKGGAAGAGNNSSRRPKQPPRPQQLHYCDVCKISCAGPQTYREHLEGQKHKKREASLKLQASAQTAATNRGNNYHCELCDVTCTGTDAYAAHVRGAKHQKVVKLHQKLGKPIPSDEPKKMSKINFVPASNAAGGTSTAAVTAAAAKVGEATESQAAAAPAVEAAESADDNVAADANDNIKPVGGEYIEEIKDDEGKILSFNCKLCDCKFNDPNAKEMHMKGRRHRLQYKRKVQPDLVVEFKPRQSRLAGARAQRALMQAHRNANASYGDEHDGGNGMYWDEQRRRGQYEDEYDYSNWMARSFGGQHAFGGRMGGGNGPPPFFGMMPSGANVRRPESNDDRHAIARHAEIYPQEDELQTIQRIVSHTERALKFVSDTFADNLNNHNNDNGPAVKKEKLDNGNGGASKDGRENQMISFHKEADTTGCVRILKGVMRVGYLAKGLLLQGDVNVELVVLCAEKPTVGLLKRVAALLPVKLKEVAGESSPVKYEVETEIEQSAVIVRDEFVTVKISLTSPLLREASSNSDGGNANAEDGKADGDETANDNALLPKGPCLKALAELRHAKWFQARATSLQSCVMVIRILRDLCQRLPAWGALSQWALELLVEKVISSAGFPISPGDCLRRIMEALACGFLINGPGLLDPCEKEPTDALANVTKQQREDLTVSAQKFLRFIAFRQIYKVLDMDQLPAMKFPMRPWRLNRKRRRSSGKGGAGDGGDTMDGEESASDEKIAKIDCSMDTDAAPASSAVVA